MKKVSLKDRFDFKNNSFTILSILASILILYFHSYPLFYGINTRNSDIISGILVGENLGSILVAMFFTISGFMITNSIKNSKSTGEYLVKRVKKIFPPLIFCLIISACVISPIISEQPKLVFLSNFKIYVWYIIDNSFLLKNTVYSIADVFSNNPYPNAINGSIWTLKHQIFMYILMIPIFTVFISKIKRRNFFKYFYIVLVTLTVVSFTGYYNGVFDIIRKNLGFIGIFQEVNLLLRLTCYFCTGIIFNLYSDKIKYEKIHLIFVIIIFALTFRTSIFSYFCLFFVPYVTFYIGTIKSNIRMPDLSYQIYIWGFPIQQLIMYYFNGKIDIYSYMIICLLFVVFISILSYYLIEKPFNKGRCKV